MTAQSKNSDVIVQSGDDFIKDQALMEEMYSENSRLRREIERLTNESFKASHRYEKIRLQLSTSNMHLFKLLDEMEERFKNTSDFDSPAICQDYIDAAKHAAQCFNRTNNQLSEAEHWYNNYSLPFKS
jgi:predicted nuclease with TOPRIM domain